MLYIYCRKGSNHIPTATQINEWLCLPSENQNLEFKEASNQFDNEKLFQYCVALANEGGGKLILGVREGNPRRVVGTQAFRDPLKMEEKLFQCLKFRVGIEAIDHPDGRVLVFSIPSRPFGTAYEHKGAYYMRSGECLVPMSEDKLRHIFSEGKPAWLDEPAQTEVKLDDLVNLLHVQK